MSDAPLILLNYEYPPLGGGAAGATAAMAAETARDGVPTIVVTSAFAGMPRREITPDGVEIIRIPTLRRRADRSGVAEMLVFLASSLFFLPLIVGRAIAAGRRPRGIVAFFGVPCGPAAWLVKALFGVPYVVSLRGGDVPGFQYEGIGLYHRLAGPAIGFLWRRAVAVVANSDGLADLARRFAPDLSIDVVPNGVDADRFSPVPPALSDENRPHESGPREDASRKDASGAGAGGSNEKPPLRLIVVGRLVRQKGVDVILRAMARMTAPSTLTVVGDGPARAELTAQAAAAGLAGRTVFTGWLPRAALPDAYRAADVMVFPSRDEGMPNVVLEAMASGLPVAGTDIPGTREAVVHGETGFLAAVDDVAAIADALDGLAADPARRSAMAAAARARAVREYSWRTTARRYVGFFAGARR